jgi:hypothetical protein
MLHSLKCFSISRLPLYVNYFWIIMYLICEFKVSIAKPVSSYGGGYEFPQITNTLLLCRTIPSSCKPTRKLRDLFGVKYYMIKCCIGFLFIIKCCYCLNCEEVFLTKPRIPALLKISSDKNTVNHLKKDIKQLNLKLSQLQALLEEKEALICRLRR